MRFLLDRVIVCILIYFFQLYPMAVIGLAQRRVLVYSLENQPQEIKSMESPLKYMVQSYKLIQLCWLKSSHVS